VFVLRPYQHAATESTWSFLCSRPGNPVIELPTGAGKSLCLADLARRAVSAAGRVICLAHRSELLTQNAEKMRALLDVPVGLYSAGLRRWDDASPVVCAGIQSCFRKAALFGARHLCLVDEAHLVADEGMYRTFLDELRAINPRLRVVGMTATPYRLSDGPICRPDGIFQEISYSASVATLIADGFLCPIVSRATETIDVSALHVRQGEFIASEMEAAFLPKVSSAVREIVSQSSGRRSVLVFCCGINHAEMVAAELERLTGEEVGIVHGQTPPVVRAGFLSAFREQRLRWVVNVDVLTTGFDAPCIDCIAVLRATKSPGLFAQICGRGFRLHPAKANALILDFGGNVERHGPLDSPTYGKMIKPRGDGTGEGPTKSCPNCEEIVAAGAARCPCGFAFPARQPNHEETAGVADLLTAPPSPPEWFEVETVKYSEHRKRNAPDAPPTLRADYECRREGGNLTETISEWVCLEHSGFAGDKAALWWRARSFAEIPATVAEATGLTASLGCPRRIQAHREGKFWRIDAADGIEKPEEWDSAKNEWEEQELPF